MTAADHRALATEEFDALPPVAPVAAATASAVDGVFAPALPRQRRRGPLRAALVTARPRQWIKNGLVIAAPVAAGALGNDDVPLRIGLAFVAFCLLAAGVYAINDVRDLAED